MNQELKKDILVIDDDPAILELVSFNLELQGYNVESCDNAIDGLATKETPVLMLTALNRTNDKVTGFDSGADDYLTKPFELPELFVRVKALLRRSGAITLAQSIPEVLHSGDITLMPESREVKIEDKILRLTPIEFEVLHCLMQNHGQTVSPGLILKEVWGYSPEDDIDTIRVHIRHLRSRIEAGVKKYIKTVYGGGYQLIPEGFLKSHSNAV
jgi:two-component system response regulator RpaA